jgi:pimeloyl-ACP methyl ester carboxylesterase
MTDLFAQGPVKGMTPVVFGGCFGWFHPGPSGAASGTAVLLCAGASEDFCNGYRPFRLLADRLAAAGYPALRFDHPGTGDSAEPRLTNLWAAWQENLAAAADWLLAQTGAERLVLIGLRIGGTLAAMAAARRDDVAGLVLIEPCLTGRAYVSQLTTEARLRGAPQRGDGIEVGELVFTPDCIEQMRAADLASLALPAALPVAIFTRATAEKINARLASWRERDIRFACADLGGLDAMLRPSHHGGEPELAPAALLDWLRREIPPDARPRRAAPRQPQFAALILPGCMETPLRFGAARHLAGIVCRPARERFPGFAVLICNAGGNPRHGFARFGVECARTLAQAGVTSLRFDFAGLGDSIHISVGEDLQTDVFTEDRTADVRAALDALEALGFDRFALHGLCSGAYHAVHAACADPRITQLYAINLPWFSLRHERPGPDSLAQTCLNRLAARDTASLYLFGENDAGLKAFERHFGARGNLLPASPRMRLEVIPDLDHELTAGWMRKAVAAQIISFLEDQQADSNSIRTEREHQHGYA